MDKNGLKLLKDELDVRVDGQSNRRLGKQVS